MILPKHISKNTLLLGLLITAFISVFIFSVFYFPIYARSVQVNSINSIVFLVFLTLILFFGIILGRSEKPKTENIEFENKLTAREKEIVSLIVKRKKNIEIADTLFVELSTIKSHINNIYKKESVKNRKEIITKYKYLSEND